MCDQHNNRPCIFEISRNQSFFPHFGGALKSQLTFVRSSSSFICYKNGLFRCYLLRFYTFCTYATTVIRGRLCPILRCGSTSIAKIRKMSPDRDLPVGRVINLIHFKIFPQ